MGVINTVKKKHTIEIIGQYLKETTRFLDAVSSHSSFIQFKIVCKTDGGWFSRLQEK